MSSNSWNQTLITAQGDGSALSNSTTPTSILPAGARFNFPSNLWAVGNKFRINASGRISTAGASPGTLTLDTRLGASTVIFNGGASGTLAVSATNLTWDLKIDLTVRAIGASTSANVLGTGVLITAALSAATPILLLPTSAPAVGTGFDSTASNFIDLFATFSVASASNSITLHEYELVFCN
jgi:hypothetical protein